MDSDDRAPVSAATGASVWLLTARTCRMRRPCTDCTSSTSCSYASFSCSGLLQESQFIGMLFQAARRAGRGLRLLGAMEAGPDHPQRPDFSRSRYLKGALLALD